MEEHYANSIQEAHGDLEQIACLREEYAEKQVKFSFPVHGYPINDKLSAMSAFLSKEGGHYVSDIPADSNQIRIEVTDLQTQSLLDNFQSQINQSQIKLTRCIMYNNSVSTNISMSVLTREEENALLSQNV